MSGVHNMNDRHLYKRHTDSYQIAHARTETFTRLHMLELRHLTDCTIAHLIFYDGHCQS